MLEEKTFGDIYKYLFVDRDYSKAVFDVIKKNYTSYSKKVVIDLINAEPENNNWNKLFVDLNFDLLERNYNAIRNYRNSIMHAHNINYQDFNKAQHLFNNINKELISKTHKLMEGNLSELINIEYLKKSLNDYKSSQNQLADSFKEQGFRDSFLINIEESEFISDSTLKLFETLSILLENIEKFREQ